MFTFTFDVISSDKDLPLAASLLQPSDLPYLHFPAIPAFGALQDISRFCYFPGSAVLLLSYTFLRRIPLLFPTHNILIVHQPSLLLYSNTSTCSTDYTRILPLISSRLILLCIHPQLHLHRGTSTAISISHETSVVHSIESTGDHVYSIFTRFLLHVRQKVNFAV